MKHRTLDDPKGLSHADKGGDRARSPWDLGVQIRLVLWNVTWFLLCRWTPKRLKAWRRAVINLFGGRVKRGLVHPRAIINQPWNVSIGAGTAIGNGTVLYALGKIIIGERSTIAQEVYLCTGSHDLADPGMALITKPITIGSEVFVGARAFVLPGVHIGDGAVVAACAVVTGDVEPWSVVAGNPARRIGTRTPPARNS